MIKAIIIEDEPKATQLLYEMLREIDPSISIIDKCSDLPEAVKSIKKNAPDLVFLDVELPVYSGLQLMEFLNPEEITFKIIFTTASNEHALRAFHMSATDYILKPIQFEKLKIAVQKYLQTTDKINNLPYVTLKDNLLKTDNQKIIIPQANGYEIIKLDNIIFIKAEGSYAKIFLQDESTLLASNNLKHFDDMLNDKNHFIRIHRSYLVNIHFAKRIIRNDGTQLILENGISLPISGDRMDTLVQFFIHK